MGSVVLSPARSQQLYHPFTMLGGAVNPATTASEPALRPSSQLETASASSRSASSTAPHSNTPTSSTVPPATSSTNLPPCPPHDAPARLQSQSHAPAQPSSRASGVSASGHDRPSSASMTSHAGRAPSSREQSRSQHAQGAGQTGVPAPAIPPAWPSASPSSPRLQPTYRSSRSLGGSEASSPSKIKVRDLSHIHSFASEEFLAQSQRPRRPGQERQFEISSMPVTDIIEMVAGLLTKITTTNDMHHEHVHRHIPPPDGTASLSPQATSVLAFHGKNVPSITILSYLSRIHKYCPTTYEVFLSLLVYFDRMTEMINKGRLQKLRRRANRSAAARSASADTSTPQRGAHPTPPPSTGMTAEEPRSPESSAPSSDDDDDDDSLSHLFVVDSFNIHRLVIAGVTCASKFFSDVFYTNSRYAKVGGLPLVELNHLELQFLLLNDFRLAIPVEELEAYGTMLVEFYAREIVAKKQQEKQQAAAAAAAPGQSPAQGSPTEGVYMRSGRTRSGDEVSQTPTPP
ncbi:putative cyclin-dependent protein kinase complex component [Thermoascus aurantiacus ATCC 26904]